MALVASVIGTQLRVAMLAADCGATDNPALTSFCDTFADWLVTTLTTQTTLVPVLVAPPTGGPVTGTVVIT